MNANCPKCQQQTTFVSIENNKYQCQKCKTILHKCHNDSCINMVSFGLCRKCIGRGLKNTGAGAITVIVVVVGGATIKILSGGKGKNIK